MLLHFARALRLIRASHNSGYYSSKKRSSSDEDTDTLLQQRLESINRMDFVARVLFRIPARVLNCPVLASAYPAAKPKPA